jgi:hypothetical protein
MCIRIVRFWRSTPSTTISFPPFQSHPQAHPQTPPNSPANLKSMRRHVRRPELLGAGKAGFMLGFVSAKWLRFVFLPGGQVGLICNPRRGPHNGFVSHLRRRRSGGGKLGDILAGEPSLAAHGARTPSLFKHLPSQLARHFGIERARGGLGWVHSGSGAHELASFRTPGHGPNWLRFATPAGTEMAKASPARGS